MRRRRCTKFIPDSDSDFALMSRNFAVNIAKDPARFHLTAEDSAKITAAMEQFRKALTDAIGRSSRTDITIARKDEARRKAEQVIRRYGNILRANDQISGPDRIAIGMKQRPTRLRRRKCPMTAPLLSFIGVSRNSTAAYGRHILKYRHDIRSGTRAKPPGAARLELFVELVAPGEPVPRHPGELSGGRPWYLRSFTRNPMVVQFPMPRAPMLIVYWGRWADATGQVGPWSETVIARVEGWEPARGILYCDSALDPQQLSAGRQRAQRQLAHADAPMLPSPAAVDASNAPMLPATAPLQLPDLHEPCEVSIRQLQTHATEIRMIHLPGMPAPKLLPEVA